VLAEFGKYVINQLREEAHDSEEYAMLEQTRERANYFPRSLTHNVGRQRLKKRVKDIVALGNDVVSMIFSTLLTVTRNKGKDTMFSRVVHKRTLLTNHVEERKYKSNLGP